MRGRGIISSAPLPPPSEPLPVIEPLNCFLHKKSGRVLHFDAVVESFEKPKNGPGSGVAVVAVAIAAAHVVVVVDGV